MEHKYYYDECRPYSRSVPYNPLALFCQGLVLQTQSIHALKSHAIDVGIGVIAGAAATVKNLAFQCLYPYHDPYHGLYHDPYHVGGRYANYPHWKDWCATTNIQFKTRLGETRIVTFLVENNRSHQAQITFKATPLVDAHGNQVSGSFVTFEPKNVTLETGETTRVKATFAIEEPLRPGVSYFTEFILEGCPAKPISVGILILPENVNEFYAACDSCRRRKGHFVEFCQDPYPYGRHYSHCGSHCGYCGSHCGCCGPRDPHGHWLKNWPCNWVYLGNPAVTHMD